MKTIYITLIIEILLLFYVTTNTTINGDTKVYSILVCVITTLIVIILTLYIEQDKYRRLHINTKFYIDILSNDIITIRDMDTHIKLYHKKIDYINPNPIEQLVINNKQPLLIMSDFIRFKSTDFKIKVPKNTEDVAIYILNLVNNLNPHATYIINDSGEDWVQLINTTDPQDTINFTEY